MGWNTWTRWGIRRGWGLEIGPRFPYAVIRIDLAPGPDGRWTARVNGIKEMGPFPTLSAAQAATERWGRRSDRHRSGPLSGLSQAATGHVPHNVGEGWMTQTLTPGDTRTPFRRIREEAGEADGLGRPYEIQEIAAALGISYRTARRLDRDPDLALVYRLALAAWAAGLPPIA